MAGVVESVECVIDITFIESIIAVFINAHWLGIMTIPFSLIFLVIGIALVLKARAAASSNPARTTSRYLKIFRWILIIFGLTIFLLPIVATLIF